MGEKIPAPHRLLREWEAWAAKNKEHFLATEYVEQTTPPMERLTNYEGFIRAFLPKGAKVEVRERSGEDLLDRVAAAYNTATKTFTFFKDAPITPTARAIIEHEVRHWEQDDRGKGMPKRPSVGDEIDAQLHILQKLSSSPEGKRIPVLINLFAKAFPDIRSGSEEVLRALARGESLNEALARYKKRLMREGLRREDAEGLAERLMKELVSYYAYIYAPLSIHGGDGLEVIQDPRKPVRDMAKFLLSYVEHMKHIESAAEEADIHALDGRGEEAIKIMEDAIKKALRDAHAKGLPTIPLLHHALDHLTYSVLRSAFKPDEAERRLQEMWERLLRHALELYEKES